MKNFSRLFFILVMGFQLNVFSQIPNSGFENWVDQNNPEDWLAFNFPPIYTISKSSTAYSGSFAVRMDVIDTRGFTSFPFMQSNNFLVNQAYGSVNGYYQFHPVKSTEVLYLAALFWDDGAGVGAGFIDIGSASPSYQSFSFDVVYSRSVAEPDSAYLWMGIVDTSETNPPTGGAFALVDELSFGPAVGVNPVSSNIPDDYNLKQNYPNPFNPATNINFSIPEQSYVELTVYDILGNKISTLVNNNYSAGEYSVDFIADNLPAGIYLARLSAGKYSHTIKMTLLK